MRADGTLIDNVENEYLGEPSPRRPWVAFVLSLICPGLGWAYLGRVGMAVALNFLLIALWVGFIVVWSTLKFFPALPLLVFTTGWFVLVVLSAFDAYYEAKRLGSNYVVRDSNHVLVYAAVLLFSYILPLFGLQHMTLTSFWALVQVSGDSMYPTLLDGDRLLVDRTAYRERPPLTGDVVVYQSPTEDGTLLIGRIVGGPGDEVRIDQDLYTSETTFVESGGDFVERAPLDDPNRDALAVMTGELRPDVNYYLERVRGRTYHVVSPSTAYWSESQSWVLGEQEYAVLNDNRGYTQDSRTFGPIDGAAIMGMPLYVELSGDHGLFAGVSELISSSESENPRANRFGRRIQYPPTRWVIETGSGDGDEAESPDE